MEGGTSQMIADHRTSSVVLLEFNELAPSLMERFIAEGCLPNFKALHDESEVYVTEAGEKYPYLEPWIQWVTVHSGLNYDQHGVFHLDHGRDLARPCVWDLLSERNLRVWLCDSMNVSYRAPINGYVLPDPWSSNIPPFPESLAPYHRFIQAHVQEYTNDRVPLRPTDYLKFLAFMVRHGLSPSTVAAIVEQLASERTGRYRWRRAAIMDRLQFDLFRAIYRRDRPHFSTFFLNSTAHLQHMYWRNMEPEAFTLKPPQTSSASSPTPSASAASRWTGSVGEFRALVGDAATIIFCTALSQQPCVMYDEQGGKGPHRPRSFEALLAFAGIRSPYKVAPVMSEQFRVYFDNERDATDAAKRLLAIRIDQQGAIDVGQEGHALFVHCPIARELPHDAMLTVTGSARRARFFDLFYRMETKSGMHHPSGMLWVRHPDKQHHIHSSRIPLTAIAPAILGMFGLATPTFRRSEN